MLPHAQVLLFQAQAIRALRPLVYGIVIAKLNHSVLVTIHIVEALARGNGFLLLVHELGVTVHILNLVVENVLSVTRFNLGVGARLVLTQDHVLA